MHRIGPGHYETASGRYVVERGWGDDGRTDRRRQVWVLYRLDPSAHGLVADILSDHLRLKDARIEAERLEREEG